MPTQEKKKTKDLRKLGNARRSRNVIKLAQLNGSSVLVFKSKASSSIKQLRLIAICTPYRKASNHNFANQNTIVDKSCFIKTSD